MKKLALILIILFLCPYLSFAASQDGFILNVLTNNEPAKELNGQVHIQFDSEYKLLLKNTTDRRCSARAYIDGSRVSPGGDFVIDAGDELKLERFVTELDSGKRFKFVPLDNPAVDDPTRKENGEIRVEFHKEALPRYEIRINDHWIGIYNSDAEMVIDKIGANDKETVRVDEIGNCPDLQWYELGLANNSIPVSGNLIFDATDAQLTSEGVDSTANGATIAGSESNQNFYKVDYDFEDDYTEIKLQLMGLE